MFGEVAVVVGGLAVPGLADTALPVADDERRLAVEADVVAQVAAQVEHDGRLGGHPREHLLVRGVGERVTPPPAAAPIVSPGRARSAQALASPSSPSRTEATVISAGSR
ncbi:hypothetical protein J2X34_005187 [Rhodococcus sp. BE178]